MRFRINQKEVLNLLFAKEPGRYWRIVLQRAQSEIVKRDIRRQYNDENKIWNDHVQKNN